MRLLATLVLRHPDSGSPEVLLSGSECPEWAIPLIGNPDLLDGPEPDAAPEADTAPARKPRPRARATKK